MALGASALCGAFLLATFGIAGHSQSAVQPPQQASGSGLHVDCRGQRSDRPTVVFEAGAFGTSADWDLVLDELAVGGRVCAYDRAGLGSSPATDKAPRIRQIVGDLHQVLDDLGEQAPVILVGHSNGALYVEAFARLWPERVAGIAYVNGVVSDALDDPLLIRNLKMEERLATFAYIGGRLHLAGIVAKSRVKALGLKGEAARRKLDTLQSVAALRAGRNEDRRITRALASVSTLPPLKPQIPTAVLVSASRPPTRLEAAWRKAELAPATRACRSWVLDLPGGTHVSPLGRDRAYVVVAVKWLQQQAASPPPAGCTPAPTGASQP
jgi:pimeloyl-ACP methyl ester carboxylesterase